MPTDYRQSLLILEPMDPDIWGNESMPDVEMIHTEVIEIGWPPILGFAGLVVALAAVGYLIVSLYRNRRRK